MSRCLTDAALNTKYKYLIKKLVYVNVASALTTLNLQGRIGKTIEFERNEW